MKKIFLFLLIAGTVAACTDLSFPRPMPDGVADLIEFPVDMRGTFVSKYNHDTVVVSATEVKGAEIRLDQDHLLRAYKDYLVLNERNGDRWNLVLIRPCNEKSFVVYVFDIRDAKKRRAIGRITEITEVTDGEGGVEYLYVNPTPEQFDKLIGSKCLSRVEKFKRLK